MLVLSRKPGEKIFIGDDICITVVSIERGKVRVGIEAPRGLRIDREEVYRRRYGDEEADRRGKEIGG